jgi:DNA-binding transcriptional LysR family regulator
MEEVSFTEHATGQPWVSAQLRRLESELVARAADRSGRSVQLTEVGSVVQAAPG